MNIVFNENVWLNNFKDILNEEKSSLLEKIIERDNFQLLIHGPFDSGKSSLIKLILNYIDDKDYSILNIHTIEDTTTQNLKNKINFFSKRKTHNKKLLIIDDIHLLTDQLQYLIQSLFENKYNLNIIISTNDINKVIRGIQNRFLNFELTQPRNDTFKVVMNKIIKYYDLKISKTSRDFIIKISNISLKKMIHNLIKVYFIQRKVNISLSLKIFNNLNHQDIREYINYCLNLKLKDANYKLKMILNNGYNLLDFLEEISQYLLFQKNFEKEININDHLYYKIIKIIMKYIDIINNNSMNDNLLISYFFTIDLIKIIKMIY